MAIASLFKLVQACLNVQNDRLMAIIKSQAVMDQLQEIFLNSNGNNIIHNAYLETVKLTLEDVKLAKLKQHLMESGHFDKLFEKYEAVMGSKDVALAQEQNLCLSHIAKIGQMLDLLSKELEPPVYFSGPAWLKFSEKHLAAVNLKENLTLPASDPINKQEELDPFDEAAMEALNGFDRDLVVISRNDFADLPEEEEVTRVNLSDFKMISTDNYTTNQGEANEDDPWRVFNDFSPAEIRESLTGNEEDHKLEEKIESITKVEEIASPDRHLHHHHKEDQGGLEKIHENEPPKQTDEEVFEIHH